VLGPWCSGEHFCVTSFSRPAPPCGLRRRARAFCLQCERWPVLASLDAKVASADPTAARSAGTRSSPRNRAIAGPPQQTGSGSQRSSSPFESRPALATTSAGSAQLAQEIRNFRTQPDALASFLDIGALELIGGDATPARLCRGSQKVRLLSVVNCQEKCPERSSLLSRTVKPNLCQRERVPLVAHLKPTHRFHPHENQSSRHGGLLRTMRLWSYFSGASGRQRLRTAQRGSFELPVRYAVFSALCLVMPPVPAAARELSRSVVNPYYSATEVKPWFMCSSQSGDCTAILVNAIGVANRSILVGGRPRLKPVVQALESAREAGLEVRVVPLRRATGALSVGVASARKPLDSNDDIDRPQVVVIDEQQVFEAFYSHPLGDTTPGGIRSLLAIRDPTLASVYVDAPQEQQPVASLRSSLDVEHLRSCSRHFISEAKRRVAMIFVEILIALGVACIATALLATLMDEDDDESIGVLQSIAKRGRGR
jgi:hypothetical protein